MQCRAVFIILFLAWYFQYFKFISHWRFLWAHFELSLWSFWVNRRTTKNVKRSRSYICKQFFRCPIRQTFLIKSFDTMSSNAIYWKCGKIGIKWSAAQFFLGKSQCHWYLGLSLFRCLQISAKNLKMTTKLNLVVAACNDWGIGKDGQLPWRLK